MGHQPRQAKAGRRVDGLGHRRRLRGVARAQPAQARIELDVHAHRSGGPPGELSHEGGTPRDHVRACRQGDRQLLRRDRAQDQQRPVDAPRAQAERLVGGGHSEPLGAAPLCRERRRNGAVPVAVGLDHGAQGGG
jgi:hypothetical protein